MLLLVYYATPFDTLCWQPQSHQTHYVGSHNHISSKEVHREETQEAHHADQPLSIHMSHINQSYATHFLVYTSPDIVALLASTTKGGGGEAGGGGGGDDWT